MSMLSQAEIDALLNGASEGDQPTGVGARNLAELKGQPLPALANGATPSGDKEVIAYNFWSPDRFSKEQMRAIELIHEDLAERLTTSLPTMLNTNLRPRMAHSEQGRFHDFLKDSPPNSLFNLISLAPLPGQLVLIISPNIGQMILEQRLGGKVEGETAPRALTDIDQSLLRELIEHMLNDIKSAWGRVTTIEPSLDDSTTNQHWVGMVMGNEKVMLLTFELSLKNITGMMSIYIPFGMLKPIANLLNPHVWVAGRKEKRADPVARKLAMQNLKPIQLPVQVHLGSAELTLHDIVNLSVGDVIALDTPVNQDLVVQVAGQKLFMVGIGKSGNHLAAQVRTVIRSPEH
ncbi:MAG: flagellar motor switch protein FliM [Anaerolineaceae bacterium]|nr:flagellar motor switch protein FliM [Anaerolineaceae bacterium]